MISMYLLSLKFYGDKVVDIIRVEQFASEMFGNLLRNTIGGILNGGFEYCKEENPCLYIRLYKWLI